VKDHLRTELFFQIEELKITVRKSRELVEGLGVGAKDVEAIKVIPENSLQPGRTI